ncbi:CHAT domain-containing protein [uncultured Jatrophihabitans sp.]|uniref:CHAT domain-containing protein n=1 Tax=uncultured Jatrophihabitans sp. TaxID=1610747 RepID=UPI0035CC4AC3
MSTPDQIRRKQDEQAKKRAAIERRIYEARAKQSKKDIEAAGYREKAAKASTPSGVQSHLRAASSAEKVALAEGRKIAEESKKLADCSKQDAVLVKELSAALTRQAADEARARARAEAAARQAREATLRQERSRTAGLLSSSERRLAEQIAELRPPKKETLRILYLTASSEGDLRVDKEIRRVKAGVRAATLRDLVQIEHMPAATTSDLLDGLARVRPHILHFSGHSSQKELLFDTDASSDNPGQVVGAAAFARALGAVDEPPLLVVLNSCSSEGHLAGLLEVVPIGIGMSASIGDPDAMSFAARFYSAIAEGQSVGSACAAARVQMEFDGMTDSDLPTLVSQPGVEPMLVHLVAVPDA